MQSFSKSWKFAMALVGVTRPAPRFLRFRICKRVARARQRLSSSLANGPCVVLSKSNTGRLTSIFCRFERFTRSRPESAGYLCVLDKIVIDLIKA